MQIHTQKQEHTDIGTHRCTHTKTEVHGHRHTQVHMRRNRSTTDTLIIKFKRNVKMEENFQTGKLKEKCH